MLIVRATRFFLEKGLEKTNPRVRDSQGAGAWGLGEGFTEEMTWSREQKDRCKNMQGEKNMYVCCLGT